MIFMTNNYHLVLIGIIIIKFVYTIFFLFIVRSKSKALL